MLILVFYISRPVIAGTRVPPSDLAYWRAFYVFNLPSCLCAAVEDKYTESIVDVDSSGEYVAHCAKKRCTYLSELGLSVDQVKFLIISQSLYGAQVFN